MALENVAAMPQHLLRISANLAGRDLGAFDSFSGGGSQADPTMYRGGGSTVQRPLPALKETEPMKIVRGYHPDRDDLAFYDQQSGKGVVTLSFQPLDENRAPYGPAVIKTGLATNITWPEGDIDSNDAATIEIEIALAGS